MDYKYTLTDGSLIDVVMRLFKMLPPGILYLLILMPIVGIISLLIYRRRGRKRDDGTDKLAMSYIISILVASVVIPILILIVSILLYYN